MSSALLICKSVVSVVAKLSANRLLARRLLATKSTIHQHDKMRVKLLSALDDNYMYLLVDEKTNQAACVDPVEPEKVLEAVKSQKVELVAALTTHHHWDHANGNEKLDSLHPGLTFYGGDDRIKPSTLTKIGHNDEFKIGSLNVRCIFTPCHTSGHICYYVTNDGHDPAVFTGDTLFFGGCGRFFEGTADQMYEALVTKLSALPGNTRVYCGHEYSVANLKYGRHVEPDNRELLKALDDCKRKRENEEATIPSTIDLEMKVNPFMRVREASVQKHAGQTDPIETMKALRTEKDGWKPPKD